jgi:sugar fermentation stimulation protein A
VLLTEPLFWGVLLRRWQRFLAEVRLESGEVVVAHVPNSGRLTGVAVPGNRCLLARICRGKLGYRVEVVEAGEVLVGINTLRANALAEEALEAGVLQLEGLAGAYRVLREKSPVPGSRFDLCLEDASGPYWLEVKNVTLVEGGVGLFPDAVTARGAKHLRLLAAQAQGRGAGGGGVRGAARGRPSGAGGGGDRSAVRPGSGGSGGLRGAVFRGGGGGGPAALGSPPPAAGALGRR